MDYQQIHPELPAVQEREGWAIFDANGEWQLQRDDARAAFDGDNAAWAHVWAQAAAGSAVHTAVLNFLRDENPAEYARIEEACND